MMKIETVKTIGDISIKQTRTECQPKLEFILPNRTDGRLLRDLEIEDTTKIIGLTGSRMVLDEPKPVGVLL